MEGVGWVLVGCPRRAKPSRQSIAGRGRSKAADGPQPRADSHPSGRRSEQAQPLPCPAGHRGAETHRAKAGVVLCPTVGGDDLADLFNVHLVVGIALERTLVKVGALLVA